MNAVERWLAVSLCTCCFSGLCCAIGAAATPTDRVEALPTYDSPSLQLTPYVVSGGGLAFSYPRGWKVTERPDNDCLVKISGTVADGNGAELSVGMHQNGQGLSKETFAKMFEDIGLSKYPGYKKVDQKRVSFGQQRAFEGILEDFSFDANGMHAMQRLIVTAAGDRIYTLAFTTSAAEFGKLVPLCDQILATLKRDGSGRPAQAAAAQSQAMTWESLHSAGVPLSFSYPSGWRVEESEDKDHPLKITGVDHAGHPTAIELHRGDLHPAASLEQFANALEEKYYSELKNYRRGKLESTSFGETSKLQGLYQEISFEKGGQPAKQLCVFFRSGDRFYMLTMTAIGWTDNELNSVFHKLLATVSARD